MILGKQQLSDEGLPRARYWTNCFASINSFAITIFKNYVIVMFAHFSFAVSSQGCICGSLCPGTLHPLISTYPSDFNLDALTLRLSLNPQFTTDRFDTPIKYSW